VKSAGGWGQEPRKISGGGRSGYDRTLKYFKKNTVNEKTLGLKRAGTLAGKFSRGDSRLADNRFARGESVGAGGLLTGILKSNFAAENVEFGTQSPVTRDPKRVVIRSESHNSILLKRPITGKQNLAQRAGPTLTQKKSIL
jgi:hypothetical protein